MGEGTPGIAFRPRVTISCRMPLRLTPPRKGEGRCARPPLVAMRGISKRFGAVQAADAVDLTLNAGDILGLLGENGAGKTTLMNVLFGTYAADAGTIEVEGRAVSIRNSADALNFGIGMVHQHFELVPRHTVLENLLVGKAGPDGRLSRADRDRAPRSDRPRLSSRSRSRPPGRRSFGRRAAAGGDREVARARRAHPRPRRADRDADAARGRRPLPCASLDGGARAWA